MRRATRILAIGAVLLAAGVTAWSVRARLAYARIARAHDWESLHVGVPPTVSPNALDLHVLLNHPRGKRWFTGLLSEGSIAGQLYGLCGLYLREPEAFRALKRAYRDRTDSVHHLAGCFGGGQETMRSVLYPREGSFERACEALRMTPGEWVLASIGRPRIR
jgi:hypothetical protein